MNFKFNTSLEAWEKINEMLIKPSKKLIRKHDGIILKSATYLYNVTFTIEKPILNPNFNFGSHFNYTMNKWTHLVSNYICLAELKEWKELISITLSSKKEFSIPFTFSNKHTNGKKCLLNMIAAKRYTGKSLYLNVYLRSSEVTKRLIVDILLAQRVGEYIFDGKPFKLVFHINQMFNDHSVLLMYMAHKDVSYLLNESLATRLDKMRKGNPEDFPYKVHLRAFKVLRPDLYEYPDTRAKDCKLYPTKNKCSK